MILMWNGNQFASGLLLLLFLRNFGLIIKKDTSLSFSFSYNAGISTDILLGIPLYVMSLFSPAALKILFLS